MMHGHISVQGNLSLDLKCFLTDKNTDEEKPIKLLTKSLPLIQKYVKMKLNGADAKTI